MAPKQQKAFVLESKQGKQIVKDVPVPAPKDGEILVRVESAALNPVDWAIADHGIFVENYPTILGSDGAGVVEAVGSGVTRFKQGDRVFFQGQIGNAEAGTFQQYTVIPADLAAKIPESLSFDQAATLPLASLTAAVGLFDVFKLPLPTEGKAPEAGQYIFVTGGSGSVGQLVIQLAHLTGLKVIATSSPHNHDLLKSLGADIVIDRSAADVVSQIRAHTGDNLTFAYDASGKEAITAVEALSSSKPSKLVLVLPPPEGLDAAKKGKNVEVAPIFGSGYAHRELGKRVWVALEKLGAEGKLKPNPLKVLDGGLAGIAEGQDQQRAGNVSGFKFIAKPQQ